MTAPQALAHSLRRRHVAMISFGGIIGAGLFVGSSTAILLAGPGVLLAYALSGTLIFLIMRMLGEMAVARPGLGSFSSYAALGLGPWAGFLTGWLYSTCNLPFFSGLLYFILGVLARAAGPAGRGLTDGAGGQS